MSNALAIAATTTTLRNLLHTNMKKRDDLLDQVKFTTLPPDLARGSNTELQLNLFLYQTSINAAWRNWNVPGIVKPGESAAPPLPLNLYYLVTAYGADDGDMDAHSHRVLGGAMSVLHDHAILSRAEIMNALKESELAEQLESLRVTPWSMNVDEMSKLWTIFQTEYRISAAYEVTVVLIDSRIPVKAALPVLKRGPADRGAEAQGSLAPVLDSVVPPRSQSAVRLGEELTITGAQIDGVGAKVRFTNARFDLSIELDPVPGTNGTLTVRIPDTTADPNALDNWVPGLYSVGLVQRVSGQPTIASNELPAALAPWITVSPNNGTHGTVDLTVTCEPRIRDRQRALLLFGDRQIAPDAIATPDDVSTPTTLTFAIPDVVAGDYVVRLRVDGVDSIPVIYAGTPPLPAFDAQQRVVVT